MKIYKCNYCKKEIKQMHVRGVSLRNVNGPYGGILISQPKEKKHFCNETCFWDWCIKALDKVGKLKSNINFTDPY